MKGLTFMQLCHAISLTLFVHSFYADPSIQSSLVPISFMANDYRNNSRTQQQYVTDHWSNGSIHCPQQCRCLYALSTFTNEPLRTVNCSNTSIPFVPKHIPIETESLVLIHNSYDSLSVDSFSTLDHLLELNLTYNRLTHLTRGHVFNNLSHLKLLDLSNNNFRQLFAGIFHGLRRLQVLIISSGQLKFLDEHTFDGLEMLNELDLSNNQISSIYLELFQSISNLKSLILKSNHISHLTGGIFTSMTTLRKLDLAQNKIISINDNAFVGLDQLEELHLEDNSLVRVPAIALQSLKRIVTINMDSNPVQQLSTGDFVHLPANRISMTNCPQLQLVDRGAFWDLPNLYTLRLNGNPRLAFIDSQALVGLPLLHTIELHDCGLKTIQNDIINNIVANELTAGAIAGANSAKHEHHFKRSIRVTLEGNPFLCDCNVNYLYQCLIDQDNCSLEIPNREQIKCGQPSELKSTQIIELNVSSIADVCPPQLIAVNDANQTIHKKIGDRHQFQCRALGLPVPTIHWILPSGEVLNETSNTVHFQLRLTGSLRLFHLKPRDSGLYKCVAQNTLGSVVSQINLIIDNIDLHLYPLTVSSNYVTLVWNGTGRNSFHEYQIIYKIIEDENKNSEQQLVNSTVRPTESSSKAHSKYESVTVNHLLRSYSLTHLEPNSKYKICMTVRDPEARNGNVQLSCTTVHTKPAVGTSVRPVPETVGNFGLAIGLSVAIIFSVFLYFSVISFKRYLFQRQYEIPAQKLNIVNNITQSDQNLAPIPLENLYSPLIKHMRH